MPKYLLITKKHNSAPISESTADLLAYYRELDYSVREAESADDLNPCFFRNSGVVRCASDFLALEVTDKNSLGEALEEALSDLPTTKETEQFYSEKLEELKTQL